MHVYEFGPYRVDVDGRRLLRGGEPIALSPKAFDALVALLDRRGRVVDKKELMDLLWPGTFVEEANLTQTIFVLRKVLGTDEGGRQYIDTVPRRGYRFASTLEEAKTPDVSGPPLARPDPTPEQARPAAGWSRRAAIATAVVLIVALGVWALWLRKPRASSDPTAGRTRVVVLPFDNLTGSKQDDWLAGAFSDSITAALRDLDDLIVVSRDRIAELYASPGASKGATMPVAALRSFTQSLGVKYYVHGNYQRIGDQLRVSAGVTDAESGAIQAEQTLTGAYPDLFRLEDELAGKLAGDLRASRQPAKKAVPTSLDAYRLVADAQRRYDGADELQAIDALKAAVGLDPRYANAWALLSKCYARAAAPSALSGGRGSANYLHEAHVAALRATELDPSLYEAHIARALAARGEGGVEEWRAEAETAISLNPRLAEAYELLADSYFAPPAFGCARDRNPTRAEDLFAQALRIDPAMARAYANLVYHLQYRVRYDDAIRTANDGLARLPNHSAILRARSSAYLLSHRLDDALADVDAASGHRARPSVQDLFVLASIDERKGDLYRAEREYADVVQKDPSTVYDVSIARVYLMDNHMALAAAHLKAAISKDPTCGSYAADSAWAAPFKNAPEIAPLLAARSEK